MNKSHFFTQHTCILARLNFSSSNSFWVLSSSISSSSWAMRASCLRFSSAHDPLKQQNKTKLTKQNQGQPYNEERRETRELRSRFSWVYFGLRALCLLVPCCNMNITDVTTFDDLSLLILLLTRLFPLPNFFWLVRRQQGPKINK